MSDGRGSPVRGVSSCPFCGSADISDRKKFITCTSCGACGPYETDDNIGAWNDRILQSAPVFKASQIDAEGDPTVTSDCAGADTGIRVLAQGAGDCGAWQPIETAPRDGTPIEVCNSKHRTHAPVIVRWSEKGLSAALPDPHWCDAATPGGSALYYNPNYFDFWKPTTALPSTEGK